MRSRERPLAILGAAPAFAEPLHVGRPGVPGRAAFLERVEAMLARRWFTNDGPYVVELEERIARKVGVKHCVLVSSGTTALCLLASAARLEGEVIVPSFTFVATAHALEWMGVVPVFCDIDLETWNLDAAACEEAIGPRTRAILGVHVFGRPCDTAALGEVAERNGLPLFFDAAHAFGCTHRGREVGSFGAAEVFSFHATKAFHTFEGGAVTTNRDDLAAAIRLLRNFGFRGLDDVSALGINGKMPEVCAAMGLSNLGEFEATVAANRATFEAYREELAEVPGLEIRDYDAAERHNWHYACCRSPTRRRSGWGGTPSSGCWSRRASWRGATSPPGSMPWSRTAPGTRAPGIGCPGRSGSPPARWRCPREPRCRETRWSGSVPSSGRPRPDLRRSATPCWPRTALPAEAR